MADVPIFLLRFRQCRQLGPSPEGVETSIALSAPTILQFLKAMKPSLLPPIHLECLIEGYLLQGFGTFARLT